MKTIISYLVLICLFFPAQKSLYGQKILYPEYNPPDRRWDNFLIRNGEANQTSVSLLIDSKGFVWTGTETGLYRFDGVRYKEYGVSRGPGKGFAGFLVNCIFEDVEGTIWVGTEEALNKLDQRTDSFLQYYPDSASKSVISSYILEIKEDREGLIWVLSKQHIYSLDRKTGEWTQFVTDSSSWYPKNYFLHAINQCFAEDRNGNKWFVTFRGLYVYNSKSGTFRMVLPDPENPELKGINKVKCVHADESGTLWIGTEGEGLLKWNNVRNRPERIAHLPTRAQMEFCTDVTSILTDNQGRVWSFGDRSFTRFNPHDQSIQKYIIDFDKKASNQDPEQEWYINQVFQHDDGTMWFLNMISGMIIRFDPLSEKLSLYQAPNPAVFKGVMDETGSFWFACVRNNLYRLVNNPVPYTSLKINNTSHVAQIHRGTFLEDDRHRVYFLFSEGVRVCEKFDVSASMLLDRFRFPDGDTLAGGGFKDSKGNFWFGDKRNNITKYEPNTRKLTMLTHSRFSGSTEWVFVPLIREDRTGNIWVASVNGLTRIHPVSKKVDHILDFNLKPDRNNTVFLEDFLIDSQGTFWIISSESIFTVSMPDLKIRDYSGFEEGRISSPLTNIRVQEDTQGIVYILNTRKGVYRFDRSSGSFINVETSADETGLEYYDLLIDRKNRLWIAHNRGITLFDPAERSCRTIKTPKLQFDIQSTQLTSGEVLFLNSNELYVFPEDVPINHFIPPVKLTRILVNNKDYHTYFPEGNPVSSLDEIRLPFKLNTISIEFAALNYLNPERNQYRYYMKGFDRDTALVLPGMPAAYKNLPPGRYKFWVTGSNNDGIWNPSGISLDIRIYPPWYRTFVAYSSYAGLILVLVWLYIRKREYDLRKDRRRLEAEISAATAELESKNLQLAEIDRIKTHFFTDIAHEIRTPLSLILGPIESISREETADTKLSWMIDLMKRNAQRMMNLVNQLLDISRLDAGKMKISLVEDDIVKCIRILVYEFLSLAESKQIIYIADIPEKGFSTLFDRDKIEKIITNLLSNAFKYTPRNGTVNCIVSIEQDEKKTGPLLSVRVVDTGPGIGKEEQMKIFERFYRVEGHHEAHGYGTGIGLALVQEFVSLLRGEIKVESTPGKGSEFLVTLPLGKDHLSAEDYVITRYQPPTDEKQTVIPKPDVQEKESGEPVLTDKMKLLIIEDNEDLRNFIRKSLEDEYTILESDNGNTGLKAAFTMMPDLIVTDIMMPDLDGMELCSILKNDLRTSHIPVVMLTAKATPEDKIAGLKTGADDYIVKPFSIAELGTRISNLLLMRNKLKLKYSKFQLAMFDNKTIESVDDQFMLRVLKIIHAHISDFLFDVEMLLEQLGMSRTHFTRKLKVLTGLSPGILIRNIRLERAATLLLEKAGNITQVANSVGISNPSHFTKAFRDHFGVSPRKYLKHRATT